MIIKRNNNNKQSAQNRIEKEKVISLTGCCFDGIFVM